MRKVRKGQFNTAWLASSVAVSQRSKPSRLQGTLQICFNASTCSKFSFRKELYWGFQCKMSQNQVKKNYFCLILYHCFCKSVLRSCTKYTVFLAGSLFSFFRGRARRLYKNQNSFYWRPFFRNGSTTAGRSITAGKVMDQEKCFSANHRLPFAM